MLIKPIHALLLLSLLSGCIAGFSPLEPQELAKAVKITGIKFDPSVMYTGPDIRIASMEGDTKAQWARLYAERSKSSGDFQYFVQADVTYVSRSARNYSSINFADSTKVLTKTLERKQESCYKNDCVYTEKYRFPVALSRLEQDEQKDLEFRLNSKSGEQSVYSISRDYIEGFLIATRIYGYEAI